MGDEDNRSWAEKRIDARRADKGLPSKGSTTTNRVITGVLLLVVSFIAFATTSNLGAVIGFIALACAGYQLVVAAIATGVSEGRKSDD